MTQDNALDPTMPISKEALLAAIDTAISLLPRYGDKAWESRLDSCKLDVNFAIEYLERLKRHVENGNNTIDYLGVVRKPDA